MDEGKMNRMPEKPKRKLSTSDLLKIGLAALATGAAGKVLHDLAQDPAKQTKIEQGVQDATTHGFDASGWYSDYEADTYDYVGTDSYYDANQKEYRDVPPSEDK